ncbi:MAG: hypothetical protein R3D71_00935 [Rickettsiales bacterium]
MSKLRTSSSRMDDIGFIGTLQNVISRRLIKPYSFGEDIVYEFTQDRGFLHQYFRLREIMYRRIFGTCEFSGEEDLHDKLSYILIARKGRLCVGGCRLTIREGDEKWDLPMEEHGFNLRSTFPNLQLDKKKHAEISRFAILEDNGSRDVFNGMCQAMYDKVIISDVDYLFVKSTYPMARSWRTVANNFGVRSTKICYDVEMPENPIHPDVKWYLIYSDISALNRTNYKFRGPVSSKIIGMSVGRIPEVLN